MLKKITEEIGWTLVGVGFTIFGVVTSVAMGYGYYLILQSLGKW